MTDDERARLVSLLSGALEDEMLDPADTAVEDVWNMAIKQARRIAIRTIRREIP